MPDPRLIPIPGPPRIVVNPAPPSPQPDPALDREWARLRLDNPRLHDGPILLIDRHDAPANTLLCTRAGYKSLATAAALNRPIRALGIQALVISNHHLLLGRRAGDTRIYPGLWENAPAGTVALTQSGELAPADLLACLRDEGLEELGIDLARSRPRWLALLDDPAASTLDLVVQLHPDPPVNPRSTPCHARDRRWEYIDTAWIALADLRDWSNRHAHAISPPTRLLIHHLLQASAEQPAFPPAAPDASTPSMGPFRALSPPA